MAKQGSSRVLLVIGLLAVGLFAAQKLPRLFRPAFEFEALPSPEGYRLLVSGEVSGTSDPFIGLDSDHDSISEEMLAWASANTCEALFRDPVNNASPDAVPVASFSDYQCPYCRVLTQTLSELVSIPEPPIRLSLHEFPVFGQASELAAASAQATALQGGHLRFHETLMAVPLRPSQASLERIVADIGLDVAEFRKDVSSHEVAKALTQTRALGDLFGFYGTPSMVVGRTVVIGRILPDDLERLIDLERVEAASDRCRSDKSGSS